MSPLLADRATIDFETRSACPIRRTGSWRYAEDPTTEPLCLAFRLPYWAEGVTALWHPAFPALGWDESPCPQLRELFEWIAGGGLVEAHNAWFERGIWQHIMRPRYGWPPVPDQAWRCSAAKAAAHALPRGLDDALSALGSTLRKDAAGSKAMRKMTKPRKPRKAEREAAALTKQRLPLLWWETEDLCRQLFAYCRQDVLAEEALSQALADLDPEEQALYTLDQRVNERGFRLDRRAIQRARALLAAAITQANAELAALTGGAVATATQRAKLTAWLETQNCYLEDTQAATLDAVLAEDSDQPLTGPARRALELLRVVGRSSTAKYTTMADWLCHDDRVHGGLIYHGASTGRWTGAGVQPHNFPKGTLKKVSMTALWESLLEPLTPAHPVPLPLAAPGVSLFEILSHALRGVIVASPGTRLYVADYASIEARVVMWLAGETDALDIFRTGGDIYCDMAEAIYGYPCNKTQHPKERAMGKVAILGLGYQMGWSNFQEQCALVGQPIEDDFAQAVVAAYREKYWRIKQAWETQQAAAIRAVRRPGQPARCGRVTWQTEGRFLFCTLPSGRRLAYPDPRIDKRPTPWGETRDALTYMGVNGYGRKWTRQAAYGGLLVENLTQAVARDIMADAMRRCEVGGVYRPVLTVHDELVCEAHPILGDVAEFEALVADPPPWADGLPIAAEGWSDVRYHK